MVPSLDKWGGCVVSARASGSMWLHVCGDRLEQQVKVWPHEKKVSGLPLVHKGVSLHPEVSSSLEQLMKSPR